MITIFDLCVPHPDVLSGTSADADFAADLSLVLRGGAPREYADPAVFFANTYPTRGLKNLLANVCGRLSGKGSSVAAIFRLDTSFGGGKTHGLIALAHAAQGMRGVANPAEFVDPVLLPEGRVRVAAFDGENADPANGRRMADGVLAYTPWGELAYALAGQAGYERVRRSDEEGIAPGASTLAELFGDDPTLILLDELAVYLRKVSGRPHAREQLTAFLTGLSKAVESSKHAALVYALAVGKDGAVDAYADENQFIADKMAEAESVSARKATLLNPTEDDETAHVIRRRLFARVDEARAAAMIGSYRELWRKHEATLDPEAADQDTLDAFVKSYPLHPEVLETFTSKTATLQNFQRVRGMLRILGRTVARLWQTRPEDATAIHLHHIDPGYEPIRQEFTTRLGQAIYVPALRSDVAGEGGKAALAQELDAKNHQGLPPYTAYVARTIFLHSLAYNEGLKGLSPERLRYSVLSPSLDISFVEEARKTFITESAYLDDRPTSPLRFLAEANLTQIIRREEGAVDPGELRVQLADRIKAIFGGATLESVPFPAGPWDVPDEIGSGRPLLVVMSHEACTVGGTVDEIPALIRGIYEKKGSEGITPRLYRNNLVFVLADDTKVSEMRAKMRRRLALLSLKSGPRMADLAEHQQLKLREYEAKSETEIAIAIQQAFRHLFYPAQPRLGGSGVSLAHSALDIHSASEKPGSGQQQVVRALRDYQKLRLPEDNPDAPAYIRDRTPLKKGQITTAALRDEFRRDPALPMLVGDDVFVKGIRKGIEQGDYIYQRGDLLYGQGDAYANINIDEQSVLFTTTFASQRGIWPRPAPQPSGGSGSTASTTTTTPPVPGGTAVPLVVGGGVRQNSPAGAGGAQPGGGSTPGAPQPLTAEGPLREALIRIFEQARSQKIGQIGTLAIRVFDPTDGFRLMGVIGAVREADKKTVAVTGGYETTSGSRLELDYSGSPQDAAPLKDFLDSQLRAAAAKTVEIRVELGFSAGLSMAGEATNKLAEQLTRYATGAAYVEATATVADAKPAEAAQ